LIPGSSTMSRPSPGGADKAKHDPGQPPATSDFADCVGRAIYGQS
jgi:hypothetical protein